MLGIVENDFEICVVTSQFSISFIAADWTFGIRFLGGALRSFSSPHYVRRLWDRLRLRSDNYKGFVYVDKSVHRAAFLAFEVVLLMRIITKKKKIKISL
jgi:hypothetical protein